MAEDAVEALPILIVGLGGLQTHYGALGILRSAGRSGICVHHAHCGTQSPLDVSRYSAGHLAMPASASDASIVGMLRKYLIEHGSMLAIAVDDRSAIFLDEHHDELGDVCVLPPMNQGLAQRTVDKWTLMQMCAQHKIAYPHSFYACSEAEAVNCADLLGFPVVVKRVGVAEMGGAGARSVQLVRDRSRLVTAFQALCGSADGILIQEYIPAHPRVNWMVNAYYDADARCAVAFTGRKIRQAPMDAGVAAYAVCEPNVRLEAESRRLLESIGYQGIVDLDYRWDRRDDQFKLLDVNPRIGASFRLFVTDGGVDVVRALHADVSERVGAWSVGEPELRTGNGVQAPWGRRWMVEPQEVLTAAAQIRRGELKCRAWVRALRGVDETAWWASDDPQPCFALARMLMHEPRRVWRRLATPSSEAPALTASTTRSPSR